MSTRPDARALLTRLEQGLKDKASSDFENLQETFDMFIFRPMGIEKASTPEALNYLKRTWYDATSPIDFFPAHQPVGPIIGMGFLKTLEISLKGHGAPLPIDSWWVMNHSTFEVLNFVTKQQVTMLVCTPRPNGPVTTTVMGTTVEAYSTGRMGVVTRQYSR